MLRLLSINKPCDRWLVTQEIDPERFLWIVSDLSSKVELQEYISYRFLKEEEGRVMRAGELWSDLLQRHDPGLRMISNELALTLIRRELQLMSSPVAKTKGAATMVFKSLEQLIPLFSHPEREGVMSEWFQNHFQGSQRWRPWYEISLKVWEWFRGQRVIISSWVKGYLINELGYESLMDRQFIFDLGGDLLAAEAELIWNLSRHYEVKVLRPDFLPYSLSKYDLLLSKGAVEHHHLTKGETLSLESFSPDRQGAGVRNYLKFTTMLAEIKNAMGQIRTWLESGIQLSEMAVVIPDLDRYAVVLESYANIESVPLKLSVTSRLHAYRDFQDWISRLRMEVDEPRYWDLETHLYSEFPKVDLEFGEFQRNYRTLIDERDLHCRGDLKNLNFRMNKPARSVHWKEFFQWALSLCVLSESHLRALLVEIETEDPQEILSVSEWVDYLEAVVARSEIVVAESNKHGLRCVKLESAQYLQGVTHLLILGLCESQLREQKSYLLSQGEVESLARETGFDLEFSERKRLEWELNWLLQSPLSEVVLSYPMTDFDGRSEAPSLFWLQGALKQPGMSEIALPLKSRWDLIAEGSREEILKDPHLTGIREYRSRFVKRLMEDMGEKEFEPIGKGRLWPLSASALEKYAQCPFIFACEKLFRFSDEPTFDVDVDPLRKGQFMHALFERLTVEPLPFEGLNPESENYLNFEMIIDEIRSAQRLVFVDERSWTSFKKGMIKMSREFLRFEKEWRGMYPQTKTLCRELPIQGFINRCTGEFVKNEMEQGFPFRGFIDRIDGDGDHRFVVLDYKSSKNGLHQWGSWLGQDELQLAYYMEALGAGLTSIENPQVIGALYYVLKERDREIGLKINDQGETLFSCMGNRRKNTLDSKQADDLLRQTRVRRQELVHRIYEGEFQPQPKDAKSCQACRWSLLCRTNW